MNGQEQCQGQESPFHTMKVLAGMVAAGTVTASGILENNNKAQCCGIAGVVGSKEQNHDAR